MKIIAVPRALNSMRPSSLSLCVCVCILYDIKYFAIQISHPNRREKSFNSIEEEKVFASLFFFFVITTMGNIRVGKKSIRVNSHDIWTVNTQMFFYIKNFLLFYFLLAKWKCVIIPRVLSFFFLYKHSTAARKGMIRPLSLLEVLYNHMQKSCPTFVYLYTTAV